VRELLPDAVVAERLTTVPAWTREGDSIVREIECPDFPSAIAFVVRVAFLAEAKDHHPDVDIRWRRVRLVLSTHDLGGLSDFDLDLAAEIDGVVP
jgi:4a-hydroxytetrahydrobiopterin dehydratase